MADVALKQQDHIFVSILLALYHLKTAALGLRLGALVTDTTLLYATGGWTNVKYNQSATYTSYGYNNWADTDYDYTTTLNKSGHKNGFFLGGGVETKFTDHISGKLEYRYSDFGTIKASQNLSDVALHSGYFWGEEEYSVTTGTSNLSHDTELRTHAVRAVVSYDF